MNKIVKNVGTVHTHTHTHTDNLLENKNKINERDICENASNFGAQIKKKNNITIFEKHKSNAVEADASVRLEKNQNRNNIRTFGKLKFNDVGVGVPDDPK